MAKTKFTEFEDDLEDPTATAEAGKGGEDADDNKDESGEEGAEDDESSDDGKESGEDSDDGGADEGSGESSGDDGDEGEGEEGEGEEGSEADDSAAGDESDDGEKSESEDEDADGAKSGEGEAGEGKKSGEGEEGKEGEGEEEAEFFADDDKGEDKGSEEGKISYKPLLDKLGIEYEGDDPKEIAAKINEKLEAAKQELNLEDYNEQSRSLIKHLNENKGDIGSFLTNPVINEMQGILNMEPEEKVRIVRMNEMQKEGLTQEQAETKYKEELSEIGVSDIRKMSENIDNQATKLRNEQIEKITGDKETKLKTDREADEAQARTERETLKNYITAQEDFLGIKLGQKAKAQILVDLETGNFDTVVEKSPEASKFFAYMTNKFGSKIMENFSKSKSEANREGYNKATEKQTSALHNDKKSAAGKVASGHQKGEEGTKKNFDTFSDDLFSGPDE